MKYRSNKYHPILKQSEMTPSMSRKGRCLDNGCIEGFFSHFKTEAFHLYSFNTIKRVITSIKKYIDFYNRHHFQKKLNNMPPVESREHIAA
jgi:putative transposase